MNEKEILKLNGITPTKLRKKILNIFINSDKPLSYDDLSAQLVANKSSIYRFLSLLELKGLLIKIENHHKNFYEFSKSNSYFSCDVCQNLLNVNVEFPEELGLVKSTLIKGICKTCI